MENISNIHSYDEGAISFYNLDEHISRIDFRTTDNIEDVIEYIKEAVPADDEYRNIYLARSIVRLMLVVKLSDYLPIEILFELQLPPMTYTFSEMCSRLDIPCKIIRGKTKDFTTYRHETYPAEWCAFMCNGIWHLVDLDGILSATTYHETEGRIILESEGETILEEREEVEGVLLVVFNDKWFCMKPNKIISYDFPDDQEWTLLDIPKTFEEFQAMPFTYIDFHLLGLQFLTECSSKVYARDGRCTISIKADALVLRSRCFPYTLSFIEGTGDLSGIEAKDLPLLVRYAPAIDAFSFNIRFPVSGEYVFEVSVKDIDNDSINSHCFDVIIVCEEADPYCRKLPIDAGIVGFGYGHAAKEAGLKNPSKACPTLNVNTQLEDGTKSTTLTFQIEDDYIDTIEYGSDIIADDDMNAISETFVDVEKGKLTVITNVEKEGEYALSLTTKHKQSDEKPEKILNYLLTTHKTEEDEEHEQLMKKRKHTLQFEEKMEERILVRKELTRKICSIEKELLELRKLVEDEADKCTASNTALGNRDDISDRCDQPKENVGTDSTTEDVDNVTGDILPTRTENESALKLGKKSKMCHLM